MATPFEAICGCSFSGGLAQQVDEAAHSKGTCQGRQDVAEIKSKKIKSSEHAARVWEVHCYYSALTHT